MSTPPTAEKFGKPLDPHEELDWRLNCYSILEDGEAIATGTWTLEVLTEATALGLTIMTGSGRDPELISGSRSIVFWTNIDALYQGNAAFDGAGTSLPMRLTFESDALPARKRQRTFIINSAQL